MATKSTLKNTKYNRKQLAEKLDNISGRVAARGVFVVRKNNYNQFDLYNVTLDVVVFDNLPNKHIAEKVRDRYNSNKKYQYDRQQKIRRLCNDISKYNTDCFYYLYTIQNSTDGEKIQYTYTKLYVAEDRIKELILELNYTV